MKKLIKGTLITLVVVFALIGASTTALAASGYVNWNGTSAYNNIVLTLEQIKERGKELKSERDTSNRTNEQLVNQIKDKENQLAAKQKEIDNLKNAVTNNSDQLKQAETDMKDADSKATDVLNGLK